MSCVGFMPTEDVCKEEDISYQAGGWKKAGCKKQGISTNMCEKTL
jgi:hypothetical protein